MNQLAPIVLFVYNRLEHTKRTIEALKKNNLAKDSDLYVFSDGPQKGEEIKVKEVREYLKDIDGFRQIKIIERKENLGLANSIIAGVSDVIEKYEKVIVLEDDLVASPILLEYLNQGLNNYQLHRQVFSISGYSHFENIEIDNVPDTYFLKITSSLAWATWQDRWQFFDEKARGFKKLKRDCKTREMFNYDNTFNFYDMLMLQMKEQSFLKNIIKYRKKKIDSWAIRWYWSVFQQGGLTLYPRNSFVVHIGYDGSGTHCGVERETEKVQETIEQMYRKVPTEILYENLIEEKRYIRELIKETLRNK